MGRMPYLPFYDVYSTPYLTTFFIFAMVETLLCSGITYGWASIVVVFKEERFYMDLCQSFFRNQNKTNERLPNNLNSANASMVSGGAGYFSDDTLPGCLTQDIRLNLIFTVSLFCLCGIKFPAGVFIDKCGPRVARAVAGTMYIFACLGLGLVVTGYENFLFPIFAFICMGGSLLVVAVYQVANIIYRKTRPQIICMLHGAFDSSAVVLLVFKLMYENGLSLRSIMISYSALCLVLILFGTVFLIPPLEVLIQWIDEEKIINQYYSRNQLTLSGPDFAVSSLENYRSYVNIKPTNYGSCTNERGKAFISITSETEKHDKWEEIAGDEEYEIFNTAEEQALLSSDSKSIKFGKESILQSVFSLLFVFEVVYLMTFQLKLWYFVGGLAEFLVTISKNNKETVSEYINLFGYIQFGGILITPITGFVFQKVRLSPAKEAQLSIPERRLQRLRECIAPFLLTNALCLLFCVTSMVKDIKFQIPSFILYTTVRGFLYGNHGAYMGAAFPASQFATLYGLGIFIGGAFGVLQYALFRLTSGPFKGDPFWTNVILLILVAIGNIHPFYLWWYVRSEAKRIKGDQSNKVWF